MSEQRMSAAQSPGLGRRYRRFRHAVALVAVLACAIIAVGVARSAGASSTGHQLIVGVGALPITLDNDFAPGQESVEAVINIYDPLFQWKNVPDAQGIPSADIGAGEAGMLRDLVQKWSVSPDGRTWTLYLRQGVKSASGDEMTSADVKWSFDRAFGTKAIGTYIMAVAGVPNPNAIQVVNKFKVKIHLSGPNGIFLQVMFVHPARIVDSKLAMAHATKSDPWSMTWLKTHSAGFGPYSVTQFVSGQQLVFTANPNYWGPKPYYTTVIYRAIPDQSQRLLLLESGTINVAEDLSTAQLASLKGNPKVKVIDTVKNQFLYVGLNDTKGPTANPTVREALQYAVPQSELNTVIYDGRGLPLRNMVPSSYPGFDGSLWPYSYNIAKAKALLAKAGYSKGFRLSLNVDSDVPEQVTAAVILESAFKQIGVTVSIHDNPSAAYQTAAASGTYGGSMAGSYAVVDEICYHYATFTSGNGPVSYNNYSNPTYNALIAKCDTLPAGSARTAVGVQLQKFVDQQVPSLSLLETPTTYGLSSNVSGYTWSTFNQLRFDTLTGS